VNRRSFLHKSLGIGAVAQFQLPLAHGADYSGKLFAFVQADGGWDPTSFCDPKSNVPGERPINHWAETAEIHQAGNIAYAPFASNQAFFEKYYKRMLVVNGVDAQTNSHSVGIVHNWSGRIFDGYPTTTALLAAHSGANLSMPYVSFGGFSYAAGLAVYTRLDLPESIRSVLAPETPLGGASGPYVKDKDWQALQAFRASRSTRIASAPNLLPKSARNRDLYAASITPESTRGLRRFASMLPSPDQLREPEQSGSLWSTLKRQCQLTVLAFKAGVAVSADLFLGGFDTHVENDTSQSWLLANLTESIDFLWEYAEIHGIADRLVVVVGSDFGRTNFYNDQEGKDHWPIGSFIIMEKNQRWTNRVVGKTDPLHFAYDMNLATLVPDATHGKRIHPRHIHKALRRYLGVEHSDGSRKFPFHNTEDLALFG
jgi:hypothetical protein